MLPASNIEMTLSLKIVKSRKAAGWTQKDLANQLGVIRETVSQWECGKKSPRGANIMRLLDLFPGFLE
jgi:transcriptional regulator with XRE-family HTH domain